jgi:hypothetical protein
MPRPQLHANLQTPTQKLLTIFQESYRALRPFASLPEFQIEFYAFANINNTIRLREGRVLVRLSDVLEAAPPTVMRAIAHILLAKLYRKPIGPLHLARYRKHIGQKKIAERAHQLRQMRGRKRLATASGHYFDLDEIFDGLNQAYFHGLLGRPQMSWSHGAARTQLGHYDPAHNAIIISRIFDGPAVPRYAVEYLVYHEMLHLKYPVRMRGSRRCVHPPAFQVEEKRYLHFKEAGVYLRRL